MSIESVWIAALDKRRDMVDQVEKQVKDHLGLPLNKFWSGDGSDPTLVYNRIDCPAGPDLFRHCTYGQGEGRKNHANAFLSHREMFRQILAEGYNNALILEEDIVFLTKRWKVIYNSEYTQEFINGESHWDGLYFGYQAKAHPGDTDDLEEYELRWKNEGVFSIEPAKQIYINISGLHAILLNRRMLERLSKLEVGPVDSYLNSNLQRFRLYYFAPKIINSLASFSQAEGRWQERRVLE